MIQINVGAVAATLLAAISLGWATWISLLAIRTDKRVAAHLAFHAGLKSKK